ncbi:MAG: hypothetical protein E7159_02620 [Firmicutes bacterium]|nr:hypothetical protein [Bacillota bacterium]
MRKRLSILAVLLLAVAISAYSVGGTYAKYTSTIAGSSSTARVAKWAFEVNDAAVTNSFTFNLFDTLKEADTTTAETDVESLDSDKVIAPGTGGQFAVKLSNISEVNAEYTVDYTVTNTSNIPVEFSINGTTWTTDLADVTATAINKGADANITVYWRWAFTGADSTNYQASQTDVTDTALGSAGAATIAVKADLVVTQVD